MTISVGSRLGQYPILRYIVSGRRGVAYRGRDSQFGCEVVRKVLLVLEITSGEQKPIATPTHVVRNRFQKLERRAPRGEEANSQL